jgi:hypothetical protein
VTPGETPGGGIPLVVVRDRAADEPYTDEPYIDRLPQSSQLPVTVPGHLILGQDTEGAQTGLEPRERYLVLHQGGWQLILMASLPWTTQALVG